MTDIAYRHPPGIQADNHRIQTIEAPLPFTHQARGERACPIKRARPTGSLAALPGAPPTCRSPAHWMPPTMTASASLPSEPPDPNRRDRTRRLAAQSTAGHTDSYPAGNSLRRQHNGPLRPNANPLAQRPTVDAAASMVRRTNKRPTATTAHNARRRRLTSHEHTTLPRRGTNAADLADSSPASDATGEQRHRRAPEAGCPYQAKHSPAHQACGTLLRRIHAPTMKHPPSTPTIPHQHAKKSPQNQHVISLSPEHVTQKEAPGATAPGAT